MTAVYPHQWLMKENIVVAAEGGGGESGGRGRGESVGGGESGGGGESSDEF